MKPFDPPSRAGEDLSILAGERSYGRLDFPVGHSQVSGACPPAVKFLGEGNEGIISATPDLFQDAPDYAFNLFKLQSPPLMKLLGEGIEFFLTGV